MLLFFAGLIVVVAGLVQSGAPAWVFARVSLWHGDGLWAWLRLAALFLVGSNVVSNVPFILVVREQMSTLPDPVLGWELLAIVSTFAGNLTLLGSVANLIVAEIARSRRVRLSFGEYLKAGVPITLVTLVIGVVLMHLRASIP